MGCGDVCLLNDEEHRAIEGSSHSLLINLTVPYGALAARHQLRFVAAHSEAVSGPGDDDSMAGERLGRGAENALM